MRLNQLKQARHLLIKQAKHKKLNHKGDNRLQHMRICAICGRPLATYKPKLGKTTVDITHYHLYYNGRYYDICYNSKSCYRRWLNN